MDDLRFASLLCTRLCHDLVGPVGAVNNGLELLADQSSGIPDEIVELVQQSGGEAVRRLRFFRAAYGIPGGGNTLEAARVIAQDLFVSGKIALDWPEAPPGLARRDELARLLLNMVVCASETLPRGGRVAVRLAAAEDLALRVAATGVTIKIPEAARENLAGATDVAALDPRMVAFYLTARLAAALGGAVELATPAPDTAELCASVPARA